MSRADTLRGEIARLTKKDAALKKDLAKHREAEQKALASAGRKRRDAARTTSDITRRSAEQAAEREDKRAAQTAKSVADLSKKIGDNSDAIARKQKSLDVALAQEQRARDRKDDQRRRTEKTHAREIARLSGGGTGGGGRFNTRNLEVRYVHVHPPKPEQLRVLYLTANPQATERVYSDKAGNVLEEGTYLRVDREVREVKKQLKSAKYRDLVRIEHEPAATPFDVVNGLNDHRPHVVHISSHAVATGVLLENEAGTEEGVELDFTLLAKVLGASDTTPDLLVLNSCDSLAGADDLLQTVPVVIGMSDSIDDLAAIAFAMHFYGAVGAAQSVGAALDQARNAMTILALDDFDLPEARARDDIDLYSRHLVKPLEPGPRY